MEKPQIDTLNRFVVASNGKFLTMLNPPGPREAISKENALNLAAYLVSLVGDRTRFDEVLAAIESA